MAQGSEVMNGGESPLASSVQAAEGATSGQLQAGATQLDGGPAPTHVSGQVQQHTVGASQDASGVAPIGGLVTSAGAAQA